MRNLLVLILFFSLSIVSPLSYSGAVAVTPMQNAVSGAVQGKMKQRGFGSNDPRYGQTLEGAGSALAGYAAGAAAVTGLGITGPAWLTVGAAAGIGALVSQAIDDFLDWWKGGPHAYVPPKSTPLIAGAIVWHSATDGCQGWATTPDALNVVCTAYAQSTRTDGTKISSGACAVTGNSATCEALILAAGASESEKGYNMYGKSGGNPYNCPSGYADMNGCKPDPLLKPKPATWQEAVDGLTPEERASPLSPDVIAAIANEAWRRAAEQPGYAGFPYPASSPITGPEVAAQQAASPAAWPNVGHSVSPQVAPAGYPSSTPWMLPNTPEPVTTVEPGTNPNPSTNPASGSPQVNLGPDPGIGAPTLEATPTAQMILAPLLGLFPSLKNFVVPSHAGVCPRPTMSLFGQSLALEAHCDVAESVRGALAAIMAFVWIAVSLFIVLRA